MAKNRKRFLDSIGSALRENVVEEVLIEQKILPKKKLGFLDNLSTEALEGEAIEGLMPTVAERKMVKNNKTSLLMRPVNYIHYSTEILTESLEKIRDIADSHRLPIQDVINKALTDYVHSNWNPSLSEDE
ncbi:MAG: hypothetical protein ACKVTZ_22325 [Bacteroidia bacterium]